MLYNYRLFFLRGFPGASSLRPLSPGRAVDQALVPSTIASLAAADDVISQAMAEAFEGLTAIIPRHNDCVLSRSYVAAYAFGRRAGTVCTPVTTDREAEHV